MNATDQERIAYQLWFVKETDKAVLFALGQIGHAGSTTQFWVPRSVIPVLVMQPSYTPFEWNSCEVEIYAWFACKVPELRDAETLE